MKPNKPTHTEILIREAAPQDAGIIVTLIRQLATGSAEQSPISETYALHYLSGINRKILLAQRGDRVEGLLSYSVRPDLFHAGNSVLIEELVVDEGSRGEGIGSALMSALLERLPDLDCRELCLAVMPDNERAIRFYRKHGFAEEALFLERHFAE
jgi:ribosomal protein S18 acetylase RimI-like enzyme